MANGDSNGNGTWYKLVIGITVTILMLFVGTTINLAGSQMDKLEDGKVSQEVYLNDKEYLKDRLDRMDKKLDKLLDARQ